MGCYMYFTCDSHGKGASDATGGLETLSYRLCRELFVPFWSFEPPPLLPLFHGGPSNTPSTASVEATTEQDLSTCAVASVFLLAFIRPHAPVPIAPFGGRLNATPCERGDVPLVLPGVVGAYRPRSLGVCSCARAGCPLPVPPLVALEFVAVCHDRAFF